MPTMKHTRRVGDLLQIVQGIVDEVDEFLRTGKGGNERKRELMSKQAAAIDAMTKAMSIQHELLTNMKTTGRTMPARRATDVPESGERERPNLQAVEDQEVADIRRRAGVES